MAKYAPNILATGFPAEWAVASGVGVSLSTDDTVDVLQVDGSSSGGSCFWTGVPASNDMEVLYRLRGTVSSSSRHKGPAVRVQGIDADQRAYIGSHAGTTSFGIRITTTGGNSGTSLASDTAAFSALTYHWRRVRASGTQIQFKWWQGTLEDEPGTWNLSTTDSTLTSGRAGFSGADNGAWYITEMYFATDGDTAGPVASGPGVPTSHNFSDVLSTSMRQNWVAPA